MLSFLTVAGAFCHKQNTHWCARGRAGKRRVVPRMARNSGTHRQVRLTEFYSSLEFLLKLVSIICNVASEVTRNGGIDPYPQSSITGKFKSEQAFLLHWEGTQTFQMCPSIWGPVSLEIFVGLVTRDCFRNTTLGMNVDARSSLKILTLHGLQDQSYNWWIPRSRYRNLETHCRWSLWQWGWDSRQVRYVERLKTKFWSNSLGPSGWFNIWSCPSGRCKVFVPAKFATSDYLWKFCWCLDSCTGLYEDRRWATGRIFLKSFNPWAGKLIKNRACSMKTTLI